MPTVISRDGTELFVEVLGDGEPVVLLAHGLTGNRNELAIFAPFLPGTKVLMDFRGHGQSGRPTAGSYTFERLAEDLEAVADAYGATVVAGGSMGAAATLRVLESKPDRFAKLIILLPARLEVGDETYTRLSRMADLLEEHGPERTAEIVLAQEGDSFHSTDVARELEADMPNAELVILPDQHALLREIPALMMMVHNLLAP